MIKEITGPLSLQAAVSEEQRRQALDLLQRQRLPVADIDEDKILYLLLKNDKAVGTVGLEIFEDCALLRSVSVVKEEQGKGYGKFMNAEIEKYVQEYGIACLYLLTTTAKDFFDRQGYCVINRDDAPAVIKQTAEFSSLCPASAVVMKKKM